MDFKIKVTHADVRCELEEQTDEFVRREITDDDVQKVISKMQELILDRTANNVWGAFWDAFDNLLGEAVTETLYEEFMNLANCP